MSDKAAPERKVIPGVTAQRDIAKKVDANDRRDAEEAKQIGSGKSEEEIRREAELAEARRTENFRDHFERLALASLYLAWFAIVLIGSVWIYHLIAPPGWPRLPDGQLDKIQAVVTGGIIAGIATGHLKRRVGQ